MDNHGNLEIGQGPAAAMNQPLISAMFEVACNFSRSQRINALMVVGLDSFVYDPIACSPIALIYPMMGPNWGKRNLSMRYMKT